VATLAERSTLASLNYRIEKLSCSIASSTSFCSVLAPPRTRDRRQVYFLPEVLHVTCRDVRATLLLIPSKITASAIPITLFCAKMPAA